MPIHDWTKVFDGAFHDFHHEWISSIKHALNAAILPPGFFAMAEQVAGEIVADVLTLRGWQPSTGIGRGGTLTKTPPRARYTYSTRGEIPRVPRSRIVVRHRSRQNVVAVIEIVSPGNKSKKRALEAFVFKSVDLLQAGVQLLILDVFPPGPRDPHGIHEIIWKKLCNQRVREEDEKPLTLVSYSAGETIEAFVERVSVADNLPKMPLFLSPNEHVMVPLQATYERAFKLVPREIQQMLKSK
jgi:hypothetical protein